MTDDLSTSFGFSDVTSEERERRIRRVFASVAPRYDLMNDAMSFGIHRLWKRTVAGAASAARGQTVVDLAGGTGDVAALMGRSGADVIVCDPSEAMMNEGRRRPGGKGIVWLAGAGEAIPLRDDSIDTLTIAFGLRNVTSLDNCLREIHRVLRPGGRCLVLEFSRPWAPIRPFYDLYSFHVIPRLGAWIARQPEAYAYLVESIRRFPDQEQLAAMMMACGFDKVTYRNLSFGIACLHIGRKPVSGASPQ
ncbi:MAG: class I SAM-dependent methyltransferase [Rhodospirillales bacterium]|nr:class I SAM-dependent methyltransferase [Rhodospirillales bacterium]MCW8860996.1 class I SAM-dependent methyltransferase [Rhodospirillales bacterium]MCW8952834.1 class I SAM-dependent methyltransferase [Rhodospirillales bacterium]MCW9001962.1 class I SAM-dependent methyltransferase [Rhodospirillales bacterium]